MQCGQVCGQHTISFLGPWGVHIAGPESGLNMSHGNVMVKRSQRRHKDSSSVTLHEDEVRFLHSQIFIESGYGARRKGGERLVWPHQIQVGIGSNLKNVQHLVQHLAMLCGNTDSAPKTRIAAKSQDYRREFDGFRTRTEYDRDFHVFCSWGARRTVVTISPPQRQPLTSFNFLLSTA